MNKEPALHTKQALSIGGNVWESNPPNLFLDLSGFEGRGIHRDNIRFQNFIHVA